MLALAPLFLSPTPPRWVDGQIAGYSLARDATRYQTGIADPTTGLFVVRRLDCDGAHLSLTLTRDRNVVERSGYDVPGFESRGPSVGSWPLTSRSLPTLATGKGVHIGDAPSTVTRTLGRPAKIVRSGARGQFTEHRYLWRIPAGSSSEFPVVNEQVYTFKGERLIEIAFYRNLVGAC